MKIMDIYRNHKAAVLTVAAVAMLVFSCMTIEDIIFPENPQVDSEIEVSVKIRLVTETDDNAHLVFGVLAPKSWHLADNAVLSYTTSGYAAQGFPEVVDEALSLVSPSEIEPSTQMPWSMAHQSILGLMDNFGDVEWTVFKSSTSFTINDNVSKEPIDAVVKIKLKTGPDNIRFNMGFHFCGDHYGMKDDGESRYKRNEKSKVMEVTGGEGPVDDYTKVKLVSTTPATFRYGDIFAVNFQSEVDGNETALKGFEQVYLCGEATLADGSRVSVTTASAKNLMDMTGPVSYRKYIWPRDFFGLPGDAVIAEMSVWFIDKDSTVKVDDSGAAFVISQSAE
ncbi:MAG: DUF4961 domain-containing protein [Bacteroidales bacterium]|nr:DUF4961 domain-containing protein [Bacteroidales bacterium]